ncbi:MAG: hypothetical protein ACOY40_11860 [Bacillota bacterium]
MAGIVADIIETDVVVVGGGLAGFFKGHYRIIRELDAAGFPFIKDEKGSFVRRSGRGPLVKTVLAPMLDFQEKNRNLCLSLGVKILDRFCAVEVLMRESESRLVNALGRVSNWRWELENLCGAADPHDLVIWYQAGSALEVAEATLLAALERRESRGGHYREDCQCCFLCMLECPAGAIEVSPWRAFPLGNVYGCFEPGKGRD